MTCRHCGKSISILRRLSDAEFCSPEHRRMFTEMQQHLAFARLLEAQQKLSAIPKTPLNPKTGEVVKEAKAADPSGLAPYFSTVPSPFAAGLAVLRGTGAGAEWPGWKALMPALELALITTWQTGTPAVTPVEKAPAVEPRVERRDPAAWARLVRLPFIQPQAGTDPQPLASISLFPWETLQTTPLQALAFALQEPAPVVAGMVETRPNFPDICLSFLRVTGIPAPNFYHLSAEPFDLRPAFAGWPVWSATVLDLMPTAPAPEPVTGPEPELEVEPERTVLPPAASEREGLRLDFESPAAFPTFGLDRISPLWGGTSSRLRTVTPVSAKVSLKARAEAQDLPFAAALEQAVSAPAPREKKLERRVRMAGEIPAPASLVWHDTTSRGAALAREARTASGQRSHLTSLLPVSLTSLFTASFDTFLQPKADPAALPAPTPLVSPAAASAAILFHSLNAATLAESPSAALNNWPSAAADAALEGSFPPASDQTQPVLPGCVYTRTFQLPLRAMLPLPIRILARHSKV